MTSTKSTRVMTSKGFLYRASGKAANSAEAFLKQHRDWLVTGELAQMTSPILAKLDNKEILPTPCLENIKSVVYGHMLASDARKADQAIEKATSSKSSKTYIATIYDANGLVVNRTTKDGEQEDLIKGFDFSQRAKDWIDLRLVEAAPNCYGVMEHVTSDYAEVVCRGDAIARALRAKKTPFMHVNKSNGRLTNVMRVKGGISHFSNG